MMGVSRTETHPSGRDGPLVGIRVVDLSTSYAGPTATMYLADLGADVIKVERPDHGDDARAWGPPFVGGFSPWFDSANRNKRSIALDVRSDAGSGVLHELLDQAHVLVTNISPGKLASLGLAPEDVRGRHPRLVYCALSGFGLTGPDAALAGYDLVAQARSGLMSVTGERGGTPQRVSTALSDIVSGMAAALAIVASLRRLERSGDGDVVDVSLLDADLALMAPRIASYLAGEPEPRPSGGTDSVLAVYQVFETAGGGALVLAIGNDAIWRRFCPLVGLPALADDPRLATNAGRRAHREEVLGLIADRLAQETTEAWLEKFASAGVPAAPVQSLSQVVVDRQVVARDSVLTMRRDGHDVHAVRSPWRLASQPMIPARPAPELGSDTVSILRECGLSEERIVQLIAERVVQAEGAHVEEEAS